MVYAGAFGCQLRRPGNGGGQGMPDLEGAEERGAVIGMGEPGAHGWGSLRPDRPGSIVALVRGDTACTAIRPRRAKGQGASGAARG